MLSVYVCVCVIHSYDVLGFTCVSVSKMKETTYLLASENIHTHTHIHIQGRTQKDTRTSGKAKSNSRSDRIWTWFKESPGSVISKYLQWDPPQVIHKQLFWGDNRQGCHIHSPLCKCTQARTNAGTRAHSHTFAHPYTNAHLSLTSSPSPSFLHTQLHLI